ncbi:hypothetical protein AMJ80_06000 [bacterium SM23_31]|nr:MAG: hypothetical protein AMJ80_06000 [bacterium SM23_31]
MCIAIYKPAGKHVSKKTLKRCWRENPDGGGFMYAANNRIHIEKELSNFKLWYAKYQKAVKMHPDKDFVLHFRIATSGKIDLRNCHPFRIYGSLAFCHNGIINIEIPDKSVLSDTVTFRNKILRKLPDNWYENKAVIKLIIKFIGFSKLVFLKSTGDVFIINEEKGIWDNDIWYSNTSYKYVNISHKYSGFGLNNYPYNREESVWLNDCCMECGTVLTLLTEKQENLCIDCLFAYHNENEIVDMLKRHNEQDIVCNTDSYAIP